MKCHFNEASLVIDYIALKQRGVHFITKMGRRRMSLSKLTNKKQLGKKVVAKKVKKPVWTTATFEKAGVRG